MHNLYEIRNAIIEQARKADSYTNPLNQEIAIRLYKIVDELNNIINTVN